MPSDFLALLAVVILAFPMACFFLSSPAFLLVGLEVPEVTQLLRGVIRGYFFAIGILGAVATVLLVAAARPVFAVGAIAIAGLAMMVRRWLLQRMDAELQARDAGVAAAVGQLRVLHVQAMLINAAQLAIVMASVPRIV
jgi:hypothetical protein